MRIRRLSAEFPPTVLEAVFHTILPPPAGQLSHACALDFQLNPAHILGGGFTYNSTPSCRSADARMRTRLSAEFPHIFGGGFTHRSTPS